MDKKSDVVSLSTDQSIPSALVWHPKNIPTEIWQHIFQIAVFSENCAALEDVYGSIWGRNTSPTIYDPSSASVSILPRMPSTISQVCGVWRDISFALPQIWSMIKVIATPHTSVDVSTQEIEKVIFRLSRASSTPLTISIIANHDKEVARTLLRSIVPFRSQWETLHLQIPLSELAEFSSLRSEDVPLLTSIKLEENTYDFMPVPQVLDVNRESVCFRLCSISPAIRRLCVSSIHLTIFGTSFCSRLHEVNIHQSPSETWSTLNFLEACPQLRILTLSGYGVTLGIPLPMVCLAELETLNMEHPIGRERLLQRLNLPKLKSIWLGGRCDDGSAVKMLQSTNGMLKRSGVLSLESFSLDLETTQMDTHALLEFLTSNSSLRQLSINDGWNVVRPIITPEFFASLTLPDQHDANSSTDAQIVCPQLTHISFLNCPEFDDTSVLRFLCSRSPQRGQGALKMAELSCK